MFILKASQGFHNGVLKHCVCLVTK